MKRVSALHAISFRSPVAREYKTVVVQGISLEPSSVAYRIAGRLSRYLVTPLDLNVVLNIAVRRQSVAIEKYGYAVIPLATLLIPTFLSEYEPSWAGIAGVIDMRGRRPQPIAASITYRTSRRGQSPRDALFIPIVVASEAVDMRRLYRGLYREVVRFLNPALRLQERGRIDLSRPPVPRYVVAAVLRIVGEANYIEVKIPEAHETITLRIPLRKPSWSFSDIPPRLREDLETAVVRPLRLGASYAPRGILITGPPGVGKSVSAEAIAGSLGLRVAEIRPSTYRSMWYGMTEKLLESALRAVKKRRDVMLLIDDAEFLTGRHVSIHETHISEISIVLNFLQEQNRPLTVMTANNPELLDPAMLRPGRIDLVVIMGFPDKEMRRQVALKAAERYGLELSDDVLEDLVATTRWFTNAEVDALVRLAASKGGGRVTRESLEWARRKFVINEGWRRSLHEQLRWYAERFQTIVLHYVPRESEV